MVNSSFDANAATGTDSNPGNGGNGGAVVFDGASTTMTICGSVFTGNSAKAQGGAVFRVAYTLEPTAIDRCTFDKNAADATMGLAGALYLQNTTITMTATTLSSKQVNLVFAGGDTCAPGAIGGDPLPGPLQDNGGPAKTMAPGAGRPAIGKGTTCAATDQRGQPRKSPCTLGAVEAD